MVQQVKNREQLSKVLEEAGDKLVVIDFYATWCGPCKRISPVLEELAEKNKDKVVVIKIDVDDAEVESIVSEHGVSSMPTFVFIRKGKDNSKFSGADPEKLKQKIAELSA